MTVCNTFNTDLIEEIEPIVFFDFAEFQKWFNENHAKSTQFTAPPIFFVEDDGESIFNMRWKIVDRYVSGNVRYSRRHP